MLLLLALWASVDAMAGSRKGRDEPVPVVVPDGFVEARVDSIGASSMGSAVILTTGDGSRVVPIFIGEAEALAIWLRFERRRAERPLTHDLLEQVVHELGARITEVRIDDLRTNVFVATVFLVDGKRELKLDSRASDGIALALGAGSPLFLSQAVIDQASIPRDDIGPSPNPFPEMDPELGTPL